MHLADAHVLLTGGSRGIGEEMARRFAAAGARLTLVARSPDLLASVAADLGARAHPADLAQPAEVRGLVAAVEAAAGPVDVLVNNAGVDVAGSILDLSPDALASLLQINLTAPAELCRQVLPGMVRRGRGHIVNISSIAGVGVMPGLAHYSASKAGLSQFTAGLRADLKGTPIGTTLVELGPVPTDMLDHIEGHLPTKRSIRRFSTLQLLKDVPKETVAEHVVRAVERDRRHVRLPKRAAVFPMITESPRRLTELLLAGIDPRSP